MSAAAEPHLDDPVARHMRRDCVRLALGQTVGEALEQLRRDNPPGRIVYLYVVDEGGALRGVAPTRRLLLTPPDRPLAEVVVPRVVSLPESATVRDACDFFILHRFLALPVVDAAGRLLGAVDVELYTDEVSHLADAAGRDDLFQTIGVRLNGGRRESAWQSFRRRFPWLGTNIAAGLLAAFLANLFAGVLGKVVALAFFIPVVLNLAESVSSQSVALALQALHGRRPEWRAVLRGLRRELGTGLLLGLGAGAVIAAVALVWLGQWQGVPNAFEVALCLLGGIAGGVAGAAALGAALPVVLRLLRLEPRVAAGPIALAGADVLTILLYLGLAHWLLG
jgi:magnesium transporter